MLAEKVESFKKVVFIGAHPDDIDLGCAISIHDHFLKGDEITTIVLTEGEKGGDAAMRVKEQIQSLKILAPTSINHILSFTDTQLYFAKNQIINKLRAIILNNVPDVIYIPSMHDFHQDHVVTYECAMNAFNYLKVAKLICYETPSTTTSFSPNFFKLCDQDQFQIKMEALNRHESQKMKDYFSEDTLHTIAKMRAVQARCHSALAEAFEIIRATEV